MLPIVNIIIIIIMYYMLEHQGPRETHTQPRESYILESDHIKCRNEETFTVEVRTCFGAL